MKLEDKIVCLDRLGKWILTFDDSLQAAIAQTYIHNKWFTKENTRRALEGIANQFLTKEKLTNWLEKEQLIDVTEGKKKIGLILAGNIPCVGFHDWLCVLVSGHEALVKLSDKDKFLLPILNKYLNDIGFDTQTKFVERLNDMEAVIATGSNNTARYFESYFGKYPNIIRKNRNAIAILDGSETEQELISLGEDVFTFFGLGCRSTSKLYLPKGYDFEPLLNAFKVFDEFIHHNKYKNNFDFNYTLMIMNKIKHTSAGLILLVEDDSLTSRIATLHYEYYDDLKKLQASIIGQKENIQCIGSKMNLPELEVIELGQAQRPSLSDYADGVNTLAFLKSL